MKGATIKTNFKLNQSAILRLLGHPLIITLVAGLMTYVWGEKVIYQYQIRQLCYQRDMEVFKERFSGGMSLLDDISLAASQRLMGMERLLWVIKETSKGNIETAWDDYYKTVLDWNVQQLVFKTKLIQYIGNPSLVDELMNDNDSVLTIYHHKDPKSLHAHFLEAHRLIKQLYECAEHNCSEKNLLIDEVQDKIIKVGLSIEQFHKECLKSIYEIKEEDISTRFSSS